MGDEIQAGICSEGWWNSPRGAFLSPSCSSLINEVGTFAWPSGLVETTARSSNESAGSASDDSAGHGGGSNISMESNLQMMGISLSPSSDWNHTVHLDQRCDSYGAMVREDMDPSLNLGQEIGLDCARNFPSIAQDSSSVNLFKSINQTFSLENHQPLDSINNQEFPSGFQIDPASCNYPSTMLQTILDSSDTQPQQSLFRNSPASYQNNGIDLNKSSPYFSKFSPMLRPFSSNFQGVSASSHLWGASAADIRDIRGSFLPSIHSQFDTSKSSAKRNLPNQTSKLDNNETQELSSNGNNTSCEPAFKRPRIGTPSPLPTFKVRKEKMGDRITALQQLVSPFGKTDTASVLHEAIEYIKFLHEQVNALSTPYMKNGCPNQRQQISGHNPKDQDAEKHDLRGRGLCLVPISSTFPVASEATTDFWTPTFGGLSFK